MPGSEENSFPAMSSSIPCSWMHSLSLDLHVFTSRAFSSVQIYPLLQGSACRGDLTVKLGICPQWITNFGKNGVHERRKLFTHFGSSFVKNTTLQDFPPPKGAEVLHFDILKKALQPDLSESLLFFF